MPASWSLVTTVKAPLPLVKAFIAHHLDAGARSIHLFFDDPHDTAIAAVKGVPGVAATPCDARHWGAIGQPRPGDHRLRQVLNANFARRSDTSDWLGHIDIDEFLLPLNPHQHVHDMLLAVPEGIPSVRLHPYENTFLRHPRTFGDALAGPFKKRLPTYDDGVIADHLLHGPLARQFRANFQGHILGKVFLRQASDNDFLNNHYTIARSSRNAGSGIQTGLSGRPRLSMLPLQQESVVLLHFFVLGFADWCEKYSRRLRRQKADATNQTGYAGKSTATHWEIFAKAMAAGEGRLRHLFEALNVTDPTRVEILERMGALLKPDLALERKVRKFFGEGDHGFNNPLPTIAFAQLRQALDSTGLPKP